MKMPDDVKVEMIADYACRTGENPLWHPKEQRLYWVDIPAGRMFRYDPSSGRHELCYQGDVIGGYWSITRMDLSFTGRLLLFKSINVQSTELYSDFRILHPPPTFAQDIEELKKQEAQWLERQQKSVAQI